MLSWKGVWQISRKWRKKRVSLAWCLILPTLVVLLHADQSAPEKKARTVQASDACTAPSLPEVAQHELVRTLSKNMSPASFGSPPRKRLAKPAVPIDETEVDQSSGPPRLAFPSGMSKGVSPLRDLKQRIMSTDGN